MEETRDFWEIEREREEEEIEKEIADLLAWLDEQPNVEF